MLGYGATISRCPLLDIMASGKKHTIFVMGIVDCKGNLTDGNKKYGSLICNQFFNNKKRNVPSQFYTDIVMFHGDSNVQLAGRLFKVHYPKSTVMRGVEHTVL